MSDSHDQGHRSSSAEDFAQQAEQASRSLPREFWDLLRHNKKWWLTPIILVLLLVGVFLFLATTGAAPFIYTLF